MIPLRNTELRLIRDTGSPSGRYAIAWGVPGVSRLDQFAQHRPPDRVRNFLVEKRTLKVVGLIPLHTRSVENADKPGQFFDYKSGGDDWHGWGDIGRSHSHLSTYWDPSEQWAVILHSGKWWYDAIYLCHRQGAKFTFVEIGDKVEDFVRGYLRRTRRNAYDKAHRLDERNPFVDVESVGYEGKTLPNAIRVRPPYITLDIYTGIPKKEYGDPLALNATLELRIQRHGDSFGVVPVNLKVDRKTTAERTAEHNWSSLDTPGLL